MGGGARGGEGGGRRGQVRRRSKPNQTKPSQPNPTKPNPTKPSHPGRYEASAEARRARRLREAQLLRCPSCAARYSAEPGASEAVSCERCSQYGRDPLCHAPCAEAVPPEIDDGDAADVSTVGDSSANNAEGASSGLGGASRYLCSKCVAVLADGERRLEHICSAGSRAFTDVNWRDVTKLLSYDADAVRGARLLPAMRAAVRADDTPLLSALLAASCRQPFRLSEHVLDLLGDAAEANAAACALLLCNRMISPQVIASDRFWALLGASERFCALLSASECFCVFLSASAWF